MDKIKKGEQLLDMPNMELLKNKMNDSGLKTYVICERAGMERATLYNRLLGKGKWTVSEMLGICEALDLSDEERTTIFLS